MSVFIFYLELALKDSKDNNVYAFINISHIPTKEIVKIFNINVKADPFIDEGYILEASRYKRHKKNIGKKLGTLNFKLFEYALRVYTTDSIRPLYKEKLFE
jgi:hypothetical protein